MNPDRPYRHLVTCDCDRDALFNRYGRPVRLDTAGTLRALGLRSRIHPRDAFACRYSSMVAAEVFAAANRGHHGLDVYGPYLTEVGPVNVVDLRRSVVRLGWAVCDPALPDSYRRT